MNKTPDITSRKAYERSPEVLGFEFTVKQILSPNYESAEQLVFGGFGKYEHIEKLDVNVKITKSTI